MKSRLLTAKEIESLKPGDGKRSITIRDSKGLYLRIGADGSRSWIFRYQLAGVAHQMGLGSYGAVTIADARKLAHEMHAKRQQTIDPLAERRRLKAELQAQVRHTFGAVAVDWFDHRQGKVSAKDDRIVRALVTKACARIWNVPAAEFVNGVGKDLVVGVLRPWFDAGKKVTARRLVMYLEGILARATFVGARPDVPNPARWSNHLDQVFHAARARDVKPHAAIQYADAPAFAAELRQTNGVDARALEMVMLCAVRTSDVRQKMKWDSVDLANRVWSIPETKNESGLDVHLSDRAIEILQAMPKVEGNPLVFAGETAGKPIGVNAMIRIMRKLRPGVTVHGLRACFKGWAESNPAFRFEAIEMTLAHKVGSAVERAYRRDALPQERKVILDAWAAYLSRPPVSANVVPMLRKA
jgi:integrase